MPVYSYAKSFSFSVREVYCYQESKATKLIPSYHSDVFMFPKAGKHCSGVLTYTQRVSGKDRKNSVI